MTYQRNCLDQRTKDVHFREAFPLAHLKDSGVVCEKWTCQIWNLYVVLDVYNLFVYDTPIYIYIYIYHPIGNTASSGTPMSFILRGNCNNTKEECHAHYKHQ